MLSSNIRMSLLPRLWPLFGRQRPEMHRWKLIVLVGAAPCTLPKCYLTKTQTTTWEAWSTFHVQRALPYVGPVIDRNEGSSTSIFALYEVRDLLSLLRLSKTHARFPIGLSACKVE